MDLRQPIALRGKWMARLREARQRYEVELRAIHLEFLPMLVLSLDRLHLKGAYTTIFKKPAPAKLVHLVAELLEHKHKKAVLAACLKAESKRAQRGTAKGQDRDAHRRAYLRHRPLKLIQMRLQRLQPEWQQANKARRLVDRERNNARSRAWWAAMTKEQKEQYVSDQWKRRVARLTAEPGAWDAYRAQKRKERAARMKKPGARTKERARLAKRDRSRYFATLKADPVRFEKFKKVHQRAQRRQNMKRGYQSPTKLEKLRQRILQLVPAYFEDHSRSDICQDALEQMFRGEFPLRDLPAAVKSACKRHRKLVAETWRPVSLYDIVPGTDNVKRIDTLPSDQQHF